MPPFLFLSSGAVKVSSLGSLLNFKVKVWHRRWLVTRLSILETVAKVMWIWSWFVGDGGVDMTSWSLVAALLQGLNPLLNVIQRKGDRYLRATSVGDGGTTAFAGARNGRFLTDLWWFGLLSCYVDGGCDSSTATLLGSGFFCLHTMVADILSTFLPMWLRP